MALQGVSILLLLQAEHTVGLATAMIGMGAGTALVYPTLLAVVSDHSAPSWRASALGVYRLWRDGGYVVGAVLSGLLADALGLEEAILGIGILTLLSGQWAAWLLRPSEENDPQGDQ
jgi:predicted MFS family arabinose efflux permease